MSEPRDDLDPLRSAWAQLRAPDELLQDAGDDPQTRACVDWMRGAWDALESAASPGYPRAAKRSIRNHTLRYVVPFAAAACVLLVWQISQPQFTQDAPLERSTEVAHAALARSVIRPIVTASGAIEARSGSVRLIVLPNSSTPATSPENPR